MCFFHKLFFLFQLGWNCTRSMFSLKFIIPSSKTSDFHKYWVEKKKKVTLQNVHK